MSDVPINTPQPDPWIADLEKAVNDPAHPLHGRTELVDDAKRQMDELRGRHNLGPPTAEQADQFFDAYQKALDAIDPEDRDGVYYQRPQAAERARARLIEEHEIQARMMGRESRAPLTVEQKVERRIDEQFDIRGACDRFDKFILPDIDAMLRPLQAFSFTWAGTGVPLNDAEAAEYRSIANSGTPPAGKWSLVRVWEAPQDIINARIAAAKEALGARYDELHAAAAYSGKFSGQPMPKYWETDSAVIRYFASIGNLVRQYDDARERARLPRRAK